MYTLLYNYYMYLVCARVCVCVCVCVKLLTLQVSTCAQLPTLGIDGRYGIWNLCQAWHILPTKQVVLGGIQFRARCQIPSYADVSLLTTAWHTFSCHLDGSLVV